MEYLLCVPSPSPFLLGHQTAVVFGQFAMLISTWNQASSEFQAKMENVNENMRIMKLPAELKKRITHYYEYIWEMHRGLDPRAFMAELSNALCMEIGCLLHEEMVAKVPLFRNVEGSFLLALTEHFHTVVVLPGDIICRKGDPGNCMYFISRGSCEVLDDDHNR